MQWPLHKWKTLQRTSLKLKLKVPWKVPRGNSTRDNKLVAGECEFPHPNQKQYMHPPEVFSVCIGNIFNTLETFPLAHHRCSYKQSQFNSKLSNTAALTTSSSLLQSHTANNMTNSKANSKHFVSIFQRNVSNSKVSEPTTLSSCQQTPLRFSGPFCMPDTLPSYKSTEKRMYKNITRSYTVKTTSDTVLIT